MPESCNIRACISMSMKKTSLAGNSCMYTSMQRRNASLMQINEFSRQAILPVPSVPAGESHLPGYRQRVQPLVNLLLAKATTTILSEATFRPGMGAPEFKREWRGFLMHKSQVTNMNGQEVNFIYLVCRSSPCRAVFPTSCRSRVLGGIERPCHSWKEERIGAWNLGGPLTFVGIKSSTISWTSMHIRIHINMEINGKLYILSLLSPTAHMVCAWLCT